MTNDDTTSTTLQQRHDDDATSSLHLKVPLDENEQLVEDDSQHHNASILLMLDEDGQRRQVAGSCAICLTSYAVNDGLVWSPNCTHAFHDVCIQTWLQRKKSELLCPFCRQCYVVENDDNENDVEKGGDLIISNTTGESNDSDD